jgi:hypothetical protein
MSRITFLLAVLVLASTALPTRAAEPAKQKPVVVDPMDLRAPVPDPEKGVTEKYDGKEVVFTGTLQSVGRDGDTKQAWYKLGVQAIQVQSSASAKPKMQTVTVTVYFAPNERRLPTRQASYAVQGMGAIMVDGSLIIRNARTVSVGPKQPATAR